MTSSQIAQRLRLILVDHLDVEEHDIQLSSRFLEDLGADSIDVVEIILAAEEAFDIELPDESIERVRTIQEAVDVISEAMGPV